MSTSEHHLLLGLFALKNNFVTPEHLVSAFTAWLADKRQPFSKLLESQSALNPADRSALESLVQEHLAQQSGPPHSIGPIDAVETKSMGSATKTDEDPDRTVIGSRADTPERTNSAQRGRNNHSQSGSRYEIIRPHAAGGLGEVFVARDTELPREVALKQIKPSQSEVPGNRQRFILEAEITGGLEHPGIVPVYGLGKDADGRPYYAMRFIRGESLREAIDQFHQKETEPDGTRNLEFRALLGQFVDVCQAMQYAHDRGIIHRDLKPANIMLGRYGETLVVDWGLAKVLGGTSIISPEAEAPLLLPQGSHETIAGNAIGTPAFMSPEQAAGDVDQIGKESDVYSLGATLYALLTGRVPFMEQEDPEEKPNRIPVHVILRRVREGTLIPPRRYRAWIPAPLEMICKKSMAMNPGDRYSSPKALADDIELFLADEPIAVWREPWSLRARRWARKHKTLVTAVAAASIVLLFSAIGIAALQSQNNRVLASKNSALDVANLELFLANRGLAKANTDLEQANEAERIAKTDADDRYLLALESFETLVFEVQSKLENRIGIRPLQESLILTAMEGLKKLQENASRNPRADRTTAAALDQMGVLYLKALGNTKLALSHFKESLKIRRALATSLPDDSDTQLKLASALQRMGDTNMELGQLDLALANYQESFQIAQEQLDQHKKNNATAPSEIIIRNTSLISLQIGEVFMKQSRTEEALEKYRDAVRIMEGLAEGKPPNSIQMLDLGGAHERQGLIYAQIGQTEASEQSYQEALKIFRAAAEVDPLDGRSRRNISMILLNLGDVQQQLGRVPDSLTSFQESLQINLSLAAADPENAESQKDVASSQGRLGDTYLSMGEFEEALREHEAALKTRQQLRDANPLSIHALRDLSVSHERMSQVYIELNRNADALAQALESLAIDRQLAQSDPRNTQFQRDLSISLERLADVYLRMNRLEESMRYSHEGLSVCLELAASDPKNAEFQHDVAVSHYSIGEVHVQAGDYKLAIDSFRKSIAVLDRMIENQQAIQLATREKEMFESRIQYCETRILAAGFLEGFTGNAQGKTLYAKIAELQKARHGTIEDLEQAAQHLKEFTPVSMNSKYYAASGYALCAAKLNKNGDKPTEELLKEKQEYLDQAVECLREAIAAGWANADYIESDSDFEPVRELPVWEELLLTIKKNESTSKNDEKQP